MVQHFHICLQIPFSKTAHTAHAEILNDVFQYSIVLQDILAFDRQVIIQVDSRS